jgi:DNA-binding transcriptional ArsR family regulator
MLTDGERSVNEIVAEIPVSQPQVSKHLKVLREVGLVRSRSTGRQRLYSLDPLALKPIHDWLQEYERLWNERLDRLDGYLYEVQRKEKK